MELQTRSKDPSVTLTGHHPGAAGSSSTAAPAKALDRATRPRAGSFTASTKTLLGNGFVLTRRSSRRDDDDETTPPSPGRAPSAEASANFAQDSRNSDLAGAGRFSSFRRALTLSRTEPPEPEGTDFTVEMIKKGHTGSASACVTLRVHAEGMSLLQLANGKPICRFAVKDIAGWKVASDHEFLLQFYSPEAAAVLTLKLRSVAAADIATACTRAIHFEQQPRPPPQADFPVELLKKGSPPEAAGARVVLRLRPEGVSLLEPEGGALLRRFAIKDVAGWKPTGDHLFALHLYSQEAGTVQTLTLRSEAAAAELGDACNRIISPAFEQLAQAKLRAAPSASGLLRTFSKLR